MMKRKIEELREKWDDIYLLRNEGMFKIYEFGKPGRAFEPDYVLFANDKKDASVSYQIFIEPKGGHLLEHDKWKEEFLGRIEIEAVIEGKEMNVRIIGSPFFNADLEKYGDRVEDSLSKYGS